MIAEPWIVRISRLGNFVDAEVSWETREMLVEGVGLGAELQQVHSEAKPLVAVKGTKDGLLFLLDEEGEFDALLAALGDMLTGNQATMFDGPETAISIDYGARTLNSHQARQLLGLFIDQANFLIHEFGPQTEARKALFRNRPKPLTQALYKGTVRAGQRLLFECDVVVIGDVNPGGEVVSTGDIYVFGKLAGLAHAGATGNVRAVIAAAEFAPMQLRIAGVVSRSPDTISRKMKTFMEFAYLTEEGMAVDRVQYMASIRALQIE